MYFSSVGLSSHHVRCRAGKIRGKKGDLLIPLSLK